MVAKMVKIDTKEVPIITNKFMFKNKKPSLKVFKYRHKKTIAIIPINTIKKRFNT